MNKKIYNYPLMLLIGLMAISIIGIILGSFYDWNISKNIVDTNSSFGAFIESYGLSFAFIIVDIAGVLLFKGFINNENKAYKIIGIIASILCVLGSLFLFGKFLKKAEYGITYDTWLAYLIAIIIIGSFTAFFMYFIKSDDTKGMIKTAIIIILFMAIQYAIIELLKNVNSRPRYRYLINTTLNTFDDAFSPWWNINPFQAKSDYFKSWPSGHTGSATVTLSLPLVAPFFKKKFKFLKLTLTIISIIYVLTIAFFRIRYGAHFLSDVSFALLLTTVVFTILLFIFEKMNKKVVKEQI